MSARDECLSFLDAHVSSWINKLSNLSTGTEHRQCSGQITPLSMSPALTRRELTRNETDVTIRHVEFPPMTESHAQQNDAIQAVTSGKRKRRSSSTEMLHETGCNRYRAQNAKVVLYDASAQKLLENIVDGITKGKTLIRKAKAQARMCNMRRKSSSESDDEDSEDLDDDTVMAQVRLRRKRTTSNNLSSSEGSVSLVLSVEGLDKIDKCLTKAQDLCITAAFQLLRDGDCTEETDEASEELDDVLSLVKGEFAYMAERSMRGSIGGSPLGSAGCSFGHSRMMIKGLSASVDSVVDPLTPGLREGKSSILQESF